MKALFTLLIVAAVGLLLATQTFFEVKQYQTAIVLWLGEPEDTIREPGLHIKVPFIQSVVHFDSRIYTFNTPTARTFSLDQKELIVDNYISWRISNPQRYLRELRTERRAEETLAGIVNAKLRVALAKATLPEIVDTKRLAIMRSVLEESRADAQSLGVEIKDVRIKRADLPNREAIFARMRADRIKLANQYKAQGESDSRRIRSQAELDRDTIVATAQRNSTIIRGQADAEAMEIVAKAIADAPEFYEFSKSLDVYRKSFSDNSRIIFSSDDPLLKFLR